MTLPASIYTNEATFLGSVYYNLNAMTGNLLGRPSTEDYFKYSDVIDSNNQAIDYITGEVQPDAWTLNNDYTTWVWTVDQDEWLKGDWFLFGKTWLPWFPQPSDGSGNYLRRNSVNQVTSFNKARWEVLKPTLLSAAKIIGPTAAVAAAGWYGYKKYYN
jgi:hypothetical protein